MPEEPRRSEAAQASASLLQEAEQCSGTWGSSVCTQLGGSPRPCSLVGEGRPCRPAGGSGASGPHAGDSAALRLVPVLTAPACPRQRLPNPLREHPGFCGPRTCVPRPTDHCTPTQLRVRRGLQSSGVRGPGNGPSGSKGIRWPGHPGAQPLEAGAQHLEAPSSRRPGGRRRSRGWRPRALGAGAGAGLCPLWD